MTYDFKINEWTTAFQFQKESINDYYTNVFMNVYIVTNFNAISIYYDSKYYWM